MGELRLSFLGGFAVQRLGVALKAFESDKARLLLAYLAVESGRAHRRESLTGLFWPDMPETKAHHSLSQALYSLGKKLQASTEDPLLEITPQEVRLRAENIWLDVHEFDALIRACNDHPHNTPWICPSCLERLNRAAGLYRGDFLSGLTLPGCQAFGEWLLIQQESFRQKMVRVAGQLSQWFEMTGDLEKAMTHASRQVALDPLDESAHRQVMRLLSRQGRRLDALAHYTACQQILEDELGIPPEAETTELYEQIRTLPESQTPKPPGLRNLPTLLTTLVGRQLELKQLRQKLLDPACCLVTVTGAGGAGKTCLALETGRSMAAIFPDGVFMVELDTQQSNLTLLPAVARAVGLEIPARL